MKEKLLAQFKQEQANWSALFYLARNNLKVLNRKILYLESPEVLYGRLDYWSRHNNMRNWEMKLGKSLAQMYKVKNMVDFGCGLGSYLEGALQGGATKVLGFDLLRDVTVNAVLEPMREFVVKGDIGEPIDCGKWDCVLSIEAAEHLLPEQADIFVDNLVKAASRMIVLTASYAGGKYHLNRQHRDYWIGKFSLKGCKYSHKDTQKLMKVWHKNGAARYIMTNLMVFFV